DRSAQFARHDSLYFLDHTVTNDIYTLSLHDALPIYEARNRRFMISKCKIDNRSYKKEKTFIRAFLFCFCSHDYFALDQNSKYILLERLAVASFDHKPQGSRLPSCKIKLGRKRREKPNCFIRN